MCSFQGKSLVVILGFFLFNEWSCWNKSVAEQGAGVGGNPRHNCIAPLHPRSRPFGQACWRPQHPLLIRDMAMG